MKTYWGSGGTTSHTSCLFLGKDIKGTQCTGSWVSSRAGMDAVDKRKIYCPCQEFNTSYLASSP
jgi:hypothetical protein